MNQTGETERKSLPSEVAVAVAASFLLFFFLVPRASLGQEPRIQRPTITGPTIKTDKQKALTQRRLELQKKYPNVPTSKINEHIATTIQLEKSVYINSSAFSGIVQSVFASADLSANSCGNVNKFPHELKFSMSNNTIKRTSLDRLEHTLTPEERAATKGESESIGIVSEINTKKIRACVEHWKVADWGGFIENGELHVPIRLETIQHSTVPNSFPRTTPLIKTRRMATYKIISVAPFVPGAEPGDSGEWEWKHPWADITIKDFHNGWTYLVIKLTAALQGDNLSYAVSDVTWLSPSEGDFHGSHTSTVMFPDFDFGLFDQAPSLRALILSFNSSKKESIKQFAKEIFDSRDVKSRLSKALTKYVRSKSPTGAKLTNLFKSGSILRVTYSQP